MKSLLIITTTCLLSFSAFGADKPAAKTPTPEPSTEQREAMAKTHEAMAACLRGTKTIEVCHEEMMESCKTSNACPMMGHHMGKGMKGK